MSPSFRKLIGSIVLLAGLATYLVIVLSIAQGRILQAHWALQFLFFVTAGLIWVWPAAWLIKWMQNGRQD